MPDQTRPVPLMVRRPSTQAALPQARPRRQGVSWGGMLLALLIFLATTACLAWLYPRLEGGGVLVYLFLLILGLGSSYLVAQASAPPSEK